jgi:2,4-didehydro-3-deoxy-L-rhamnonate hydrolase
VSLFEYLSSDKTLPSAPEVCRSTHVSFRLANIAGRAALVNAQGKWFDLQQISDGSFGPDPTAALARHVELHTLDAALDGHQSDGELASALLEAAVPNPRSCFAVGLNYLDHAKEGGMEVPNAPLVFTKFPSCLVGPYADVELNTNTADYEVELVVVIGQEARNVAEHDAWSYVLGVTGGQDISDRQLQFAAKPPHFDLGKSRDTYGPIGPVVVSPDLIDTTGVRLRCWVNGELRQDGNTANMVFSVPKLIAYLSAILTLRPGDVIFTGTPDGVGAVKGVFLKPGDVIESELAGIGRLRNVCR